MISQRQVTVAQHNAFVLEHRLKGSAFMSAKSGENVVRAFYQAAGELLHTPLTEDELDVYTKVLKVTIQDGGETDSGASHGGRTAFADQIEAEDRAAAEAAAARARKAACVCAIC